jgi:Delta7-sterol 5-desaturase
MLGMAAWLTQLDLLTALWLSFAGFTGLTLLSLAMGFAIERVVQARGLTVFAIPLRPGQLRKEALGNLLWHLLWCPLFALVLAQGWLRFGEGLGRELLTFFACVYGFQAYYWLLHRAMHHKRLMFMHRWHHESLVTTPLTGFSMHPLEGLGWCLGFIGPALLASQVVEIGVYGYLGFLVFAWYGNIVGHANAEFMPKLAATRGYSRVISNPISYHSLHHARFKGHYGFATSWADELFGTQFADWIAVAKRVQGGRPLERLNEKLEPETPLR